MAPVVDQVDALLGKRYYRCPNGYHYSYGRCYSAWSWYGRWIFAAVVIVVILAIAFIWACINSRRRRRRGVKPLMGTGWMAGPPPQYHNNPQGYNAPPPPAYGAPPGQSYPMQGQSTGNTFHPNDGYYGQHEGVQAPKNVHAADNNNSNNDYAPPPGPPPAR
ncbi:chitin synthesis regulation, resistance to congo red-domain-containing protein [Xylariomycetidae sp. FL2044]|nr:chitin synthesis regulation, resistance to congo red-domain-containing protein [Xylariomycetidae sp. FL2044]